MSVRSTDRVEKAFATYLRAQLDAGAKAELCTALSACQLEAELAGLRAVVAEGSSRFVYEGPVWRGRRVTVALEPPADATSGELWFDPVELTYMVLVPHAADQSPDVTGWLATRPCRVWQFRAWLDLVSAENAEAPRPPDWLRAARLRNQDGRAAVTDVYNAEAVAYARCFGKTLASRWAFQAAFASSAAEARESVLPSSLLCWSEAEPVEGERLATGPEHASSDEPEAPCFDEWERHPRIGLATHVTSVQGLFPERRRRFIA